MHYKLLYLFKWTYRQQLFSPQSSLHSLGLLLPNHEYQNSVLLLESTHNFSAYHEQIRFRQYR